MPCALSFTKKQKCLVINIYVPGQSDIGHKVIEDLIKCLNNYYVLPTTLKQYGSLLIMGDFNTHLCYKTCPRSLFLDPDVEETDHFEHTVVGNTLNILMSDLDLVIPQDLLEATIPSFIGNNSGTTIDFIIINRLEGKLFQKCQRHWAGWGDHNPLSIIMSFSPPVRSNTVTSNK